jgi:hypothetical protein
MSNSASGRGTGRLSDSPNRLLGVVFGMVFLIVGLIGFAVTGFDGFVDTDTDKRIIFFEVNPLHNIAHLGIGVLLLLAALRGAGAAKGANVLVGAVYLLLGVVGLFILDGSLNILSLNSADNVLHLASAALLLGVGLSQDKRVRHDSGVLPA